MPAAPLPPDEASRLAALHGFGTLDTPPDRDLDDLAALAASLARSPIALVSLVDAERQWFKARHGTTMVETPRAQAFCAHAILAPQHQLVVPDATRDARFADNPMVTGPPGLRAYVGTPLVTEGGAAIGTLCVLDLVPRDFAPDELDALRGLAATVVATLQRLRSGSMVAARTDALTGIANRTALLAEVAAATSRLALRGQRFGLLSIGLDGAAALPEAGGDAVLRAAAGVLAGTTRKEELAARIGDARFGVLLSCGRGHARGAAERLRETLNARMALEGWPVTAAIGAVTFAGPPADAAAALAMAETLLAAAQSAGGDGVSHRFHDGTELGWAEEAPTGD